MRKLTKLSILPFAVGAVALASCGRHAATDSALSDDLKRDLSLASSSNLSLATQQSSAAFPLTEVMQKSDVAPAKTLKKASGPKAVSSPTPTVKAAPEEIVAATTEAPEVEVTAEAPAPSTTESAEPAAPAVPRPTPVAVNLPARGTDTDAGAGSGSGRGTVWGVVIRGGVGDGDHCDPRTDGRRRGPPQRGGIYIPSGGAPSTPYPMGAGTILRRGR